MADTKPPIFWAKSILQFFFVLMLVVSVLSFGEPLNVRLIYGGMGLIFISYSIRKLRAPSVEKNRRAVSFALLSLFFITLGACAFVAELSSSKLMFTDLLRAPVRLLVLGLVPVGLVTLVLSILEIILNK